MATALARELRLRMRAAVAEGRRHRAAAARGGGSAASGSRGRALERDQGHARPQARGGDRRAGRIEAQRERIRGLLEERQDRTSEEVRAALGDRGLAFSSGALQRFLGRHGLTRNKRPAPRRSRSARPW